MAKKKPALRDPEPNLLEEIAWILFGPDLVVNSVLAAPNISLAGANKPRAFEHLPEDVEQGEDGYVDIRR